jgi:DNA-binding MurR/RpiR family transcriptional regulator
VNATRREFLKGLGALVALAVVPTAVGAFPSYPTTTTLTTAAAQYCVGDVLFVSFGTRREDDGYYTITEISDQSYTMRPG